MKTKSLVSCIALAIVAMVVFAPTVYPQDPTPIASPTVQKPSKPVSPAIEAAGRAPDGIVPAGGKISIATTASDEYSPAVASCAYYNQYLVVYGLGGDIYGQRLNKDGGLLGSAFVIYNGANNAYAPDVTCQDWWDYYVVTWTYDFSASDTDIKAQAVYGDHRSTGSQLKGSTINVAAGISKEKNSAIACNYWNDNCLVVYEVDTGATKDIYEQRINADGGGISPLGNSFNFASSNPQYQPDVAYNIISNNFLVVWVETYTPSVGTAHSRVYFAHVYPTDQGAGDQRQHGNTYLINPGSHDCNQTVPAVALNRATLWFLAVFQYDYNCNGTDYDIKAVRISPTGQVGVGPFVVAGTTYGEYNPAVAFQGGLRDDNYAQLTNQFLVTYERTTGGSTSYIYGQPIKGTHDASSPNQYDGNAVVMDSTILFGYSVGSPDVTGTTGSGRYLTVWEYDIGGTNQNVLGQLLYVPFNSFLPFIRR